MNIAGHDIGVCSWSLQPKNMGELVAAVAELELSHVQLALAPLLALDEAGRQAELSVLKNAGITITAGMIHFPGEDYSTIGNIRTTGGFVPDDQWPLRRDLTAAAAKLAAAMGVKKLTTHVGFIPGSNSLGYAGMVLRIGEVASILEQNGIELGMETGQESAPELLQFLNDLSRKNVFINFDPANMILYGAGDPIEAVRVLGRHIRHVHVKDANLSEQPGTQWGEEVAFGTGQVGAGAFLEALREVDYNGPLVIEREAGDQRLDDIGVAIDSLCEVAGV